MQRFALILLIIGFIFNVVTDDVPPTCDSKIYCQGPLLHTVQMAEIFNDSKTFVDMSMLVDSETILQNFAILMNATGSNPTKEQVRNFVNTYFISGNELENYTPNDYKPDPSFIAQIQDKNVQEFATNLVAIWPSLSKRIKAEVAQNSSQYSIIYVPNPFIIPGGRFREYYYWDTYWIIQGLLISEMYETAKGMLDNFITIIDHFGFIPNGGRVYYLKRSQPPLFVPMVAQYIRKTQQSRETLTWLRGNIKYLEKELKYWMENKTIEIIKDGKSYKLARYMPVSKGPRPESYREDYATASKFPKSEQDRVYVDLKGGAESGWDYSSRWLYDSNGQQHGNLSDIQTHRTIPVDLNSYLYKACHELYYLFSTLKATNQAAYWKSQALQLKIAIEAVFWNKKDGIWYDYDLDLHQHRKYFAVSNLVPLWAHAFHCRDKDKLTKSVLKYLDSTDVNIFSYLGGTPTTLEHSGEQWDFPNAWPPLQAIIVQGLAALRTKEAQNKAKELAMRWVNANMIGHAQSQLMYEKYDAVTPGAYGGGGEYTVQSGFGWTNGVALEFIHTYYLK